jgi:hypothetical protein
VSSNLIARFFKAHVAQLVERILGKDEVHGFESRRGLFGKCYVFVDGSEESKKIEIDRFSSVGRGSTCRKRSLIVRSLT